MHESPHGAELPGPGTPGPTLKEGMVFAIEPMVNVGGYETYVLDDGWGVMTSGKLSRTSTHDRVTDDGPEVFTPSPSVGAVLLALGKERGSVRTLETEFGEQGLDTYSSRFSRRGTSRRRSPRDAEAPRLKPVQFRCFLRTEGLSSRIAR